MTEFHTVKRIDNSRVVRWTAPRRLRACARMVGMGSLLALVALLYAWQHFQVIQMSYQLEALKASQAQAAELNQRLRMEDSTLRSPGRIAAIALQQLGLASPKASQLAPSQGPADAVLAQARRNSSPSAQ
ncbi:MAG: cell division protein FtsL [Candidatus Acidiferrales bacterium]